MKSDPSPRRLKRAELPVDTASLARFLIGKTLVRDAPEGCTSGRIVEAEAYVPGDASGHGFLFHNLRCSDVSGTHDARCYSSCTTQ